MSTLFGKSKRKRRLQQEEVQEPSTEIGVPAKAATTTSVPELPLWASLDDLGLAEPLVTTCRQLGFKKPTDVQRTVIPYLLKNSQAHILALAQTGSGKTAAFLLPILHRLSSDPYGIYAVILTPTRELAKQIHQQVLALGSCYHVQSTLVVGGMDPVKQSCALDQRPHICVATPGRLAELLRGPKPPLLHKARYLVLDEADRLFAGNSGFERDVAELLLHCTTQPTTATTAPTTDGKTTVEQRTRRSHCQTLLFSATMTKSLEHIEEIAGAGLGRLPLKKFVVHENHDASATPSKKKKKKTKDDNNGDDNDGDDKETDSNEEDGSDSGDDDSSEEENMGLVPKIPSGLRQEYVFMPSRVRDAYLLTAIRNLIINGGRTNRQKKDSSKGASSWKNKKDSFQAAAKAAVNEEDEEGATKARSAIVFVSTCERAALVSGILTQLGVENVALHSLLSQNRRLASLAKFKSQQVRLLIATDVASRGLDIPTVDLVLNSELPRNPLCYVHRVGRTARAGRRGRAISLVSEAEIGLVHAAERVSGRPLDKCPDVTDQKAIALLGPVTKAARLTKLKLNEIGFDELVQKFKERKQRDRQERERIQRALKRKSKTQK